MSSVSSILATVTADDVRSWMTFLSYDNGWLPHVVLSDTHYTARLQFTQLLRAYVVVMLVCELTLLKLASTVDCLWCE